MKHARLTTIAIFIAVLLALSLLGCKTRTQKHEETVTDSASSSKVSENTSGSTVQNSTYWDIPDFAKQISESKQINKDVVGWLNVPNTIINDAVLYHRENNFYYYRRNIEGRREYQGVFYADYRSTFGDGSPEQLGMNTCVYGHSLTDDIADEKFRVKFGNLHFFRFDDFALNTPYIFFATENGTLAWEIFAVFFVNSNLVGYNRNDLPDDDFYKLIQTEVLPRSIYDYKAEIKSDDKILTLSTCVYTLPNGTYVYSEDSPYRFAIMAKLVKPEQSLKEFAEFQIKDSYIIDPL